MGILACQAPSGPGLEAPLRLSPWPDRVLQHPPSAQWGRTDDHRGGPLPRPVTRSSRSLPRPPGPVRSSDTQAWRPPDDGYGDDGYCAPRDGTAPYPRVVRTRTMGTGRSRRLGGRSLLDTLVGYLGGSAGSPQAYYELDWSGRSGPGAATVPTSRPGRGPSTGRSSGSPSAASTGQGPRPRVWNRYMEGAVRSGERAAEEVLASLN